MFRNKEIRRFFIFFSGISIAASVIGFSINAKAGILILIFSVFSGILYASFTKARYQSIAQLSEQIDRVLHNADYLCINDSEEGELSILQSEITKMTLRIREQNHALKKEKEHLAESLADIAHQLRTPLTSAHLILSLLEKNPEEKERKNLLRESEGLFAQMEWLVNSLLKLSRLDAGIVVFKNDPVKMRSLMNTAVHPLLIPMELHNIELCTEIPEEMMIHGDMAWLSEAIQNILKNCIQSVGDNGKIEILCEDTPLFSEIRIHDSGPGFEKEDLPHLFERFYRGQKEEAAGFGIGLALCKMIIIRHGGRIHAKNHWNGGALFSIRFPK